MSSDTAAPSSDRTATTSLDYTVLSLKPVVWGQPLHVPTTAGYVVPAPAAMAASARRPASRPAMDPASEPIYAALVRETGVRTDGTGPVTPAAAAGG